MGLVGVGGVGDEFTCGLGGVLVGVDVHADVELGGGVVWVGEAGGLHAAFEFAEVVAACDDFLAWVAAFFEVDAAYAVKVEHLGDEVFAVGCADVGDAGHDFVPLPVLLF